MSGVEIKQEFLYFCMIWLGESTFPEAHKTQHFLVKLPSPNPREPDFSKSPKPRNLAGNLGGACYRLQSTEKH